MDPITLVLAAVITLATLYYFKASARKSAKSPPGPPYPVIGHAKYIMKNRSAQLSALADKYGEIYQLQVFHQRVIVLNSYEVLKEALSTYGNFSSGRRHDPFQHDISNNYRGVASSDGDLWIKQRRFARSTLKDFGLGRKIIEDTIQSELMALRDLFRSNIDRPFVVNKVFVRATANTICSIFMSGRVSDDPIFDSLLDKMNEVVAQGPRSGFLIFIWPILKHLPGDISYMKSMMRSRNELVDYLQKRIDEHISTFNPDNIRDYIDAFYAEMLKSTDDTFNFEQLQQTILEFFIAGTETSSTSAIWAFIFLAMHPEMLKRVLEEIDREIGDKMPEFADKARMPYVDAFIHETLRCSTVAPLSLPHRATAPFKLAGYDINENDLITANLLYANRKGSQWKDPDNFNPENFLDADGKLCNTNYLLTFSIGKRICIGERLAMQELFIYIVGLLQEFTFEADPAHSLPDPNIIEGNSVNRAMSPIYLIPRARH